MLTGSGLIYATYCHHIWSVLVRTVSVKEVAAALGVTPRAIIYKLEKGDLKGVRTPNPYGVNEWRIYPNKEIVEKLKAVSGSKGQASGQELNFEPGEVVDAVTTESVPAVTTESLPAVPAESVDAAITESAPELAKEKDTDSDIIWMREGATSAEVPGAFRAMIQECVRPLVERLEVQAQALSEKDRIIEEQSRQLRLLPDYEKMQRDVELKAYEAEALKKQLAAIEEEKQRIEQERVSAEEAASEANSKLQSTEALKAEIQEQLQGMRKELERVKQPFWKRWFSTQEGS